MNERIIFDESKTNLALLEMIGDVSLYKSGMMTGYHDNLIEYGTNMCANMDKICELYDEIGSSETINGGTAAEILGYLAEVKDQKGVFKYILDNIGPSTVSVLRLRTLFMKVFEREEELILRKYGDFCGENG